MIYSLQYIQSSCCSIWLQNVLSLCLKITLDLRETLIILHSFIVYNSVTRSLDNIHIMDVRHCMIESCNMLATLPIIYFVHLRI